MKERLTERQNEVYEFIRGFMRSQRKPPTLEEVGEALGISSTNAVYKLLRALEKKGYIEREKHKARGMRLVDDEPTDPFAMDAGLPSLPVVSRTPSDQPERLWERPQGYLSVDDRLLQRANDPEDCLVGRAGDDGMNDDGIRKGDFLLIEEVDWNQIPNNQIAAFLVGEELRVRRFYFANGRIHLRPADRHYTEETYAPQASGYYLIGRVFAVFRLL